MANTLNIHALQNPDAANERIRQRLFRRTLIGLSAGLVAVASFFPALHGAEKEFDHLRADGKVLAVPNDTSHANVYVVQDEDKSIEAVANRFAGGSQAALKQLLITEAEDYNSSEFGAKRDVNIYPDEQMLVPKEYTLKPIHRP